MKIKLLFLLLLYCLGACSSNTNVPEASEARRIPNSYAKGFALFETPDGYELEVRNPGDTTKILGRYTFSRLDSNNAKRNIIHVPVKSVSVYSTTFLPYFKMLDEANIVTGIANARLVMDPEYRENLKKGIAVDITVINEPDMEKLISLQNDVFMVYPFAENDFSRYTNVGIPTLFNLEYQEEHPLARVEWIKVAGALTGKLPEAITLCDSIFTEYESLTKTAGDSAPTVFTGSYYGGMWYAPPGNSYLAHLINDAGGRYIFNEKKAAGNIALDFEMAFDKFSDADFWGIVISHETNFDTEAILKMNPRYKHLKSFQQQQVFYCNTHYSDYFGAAVMEPQVILKDLISIFYPASFPAYQPVYFKLVSQNKAADSK